MSSTDEYGATGQRRSERLGVGQLRAVAGSLVSRSVRPAAAAVVVAAAMCLAAQAPATLPLMVVLAVVCRHRR